MNRPWQRFVKMKPGHDGQAAKPGRVGRLTRGTLATLLSQLINTCGQVLVVPVFLFYWGEQLYGEWLTLFACVAYVSILDIGMQMYAVNRLTQCYTRGETAEYIRVLHSAFFLSLVISSSALVVLTISLAMLPLEKWFNFTITDHTTAVLVAVLLAVQVVAAIPQGLIAGIYRTVGEYPRGVMLGNIQRLLFFALTIVVIAAGGGLAAVAGIQLVPLAGVVFYVWRDLRRRHPRIKPGIKDRNIKLALSFLGPSSLFFLIQVANGVTIQGTTLIVGATLGTGSVAAFVTLRTLANLIRQVTGALNSALWPELTSLEAQGRYETLRNINLLATKIILIANICAAVFLHFKGEDIVRLWTRGQITYSAQLMDAFLLLLVLQTPWMTSSVLLAASNNHRLLSSCYIASGTVGLGAGYLLSRDYGLPGMVYGLLIADFCISGRLIPRAACRMTGQDYDRFLTETLLRGAPVFALLYLAVRWMLGAIPPVPEPAGLVTCGVFTALVGLVLGYALWLNRLEKRMAYTVLLSLFRKKRGAGRPE